MSIFINSLISATIAVLATIGAYNFLPLSFIENFGPKQEQKLGATITTIQGTDTIKDSRAVINTNFTNLNTDKIEVSTTSVGNIITLSNLASIGTITTGVWNGTAITATYGGTGSTTLASNRILLGNGTGVMRNVADGTSGQFLTFQGTGNAPTWTTSSVDLTASYAWTGAHTFDRATSTSAHVFSFTSSTSTLDRLGVNYFNATSTSATSTIIHGLVIGDLVSASVFSATSTATSTFGGGMKLKTGCFENRLGKCIGEGWESISASATGPAADDELITVTATCPTGKTVISGGAELADVTGPDWQSIVYSKPSGTNAWVSQFTCHSTGAGTCTGGTVSTYAVCIY